MKYHWRKLYSVLPASVERSMYRRYFEREHNKWISEGKSLPVSHLSKQNALKKIANQYNLSILVETGTYLGDMVFALQKDFEKIYSIELSEMFYIKAKERFGITGNIYLLVGDSGKKLKELVPQLMAPVLFWLDGHYSGGTTAKGERECPVYEELDAIFHSHHNHVIIIDDARLFNGNNDYPAMEDLKNYVTSKRPSYQFILENDAIQLIP